MAPGPATPAPHGMVPSPMACSFPSLRPQGLYTCCAVCLELFSTQPLGLSPKDLWNIGLATCTELPVPLAHGSPFGVTGVWPRPVLESWVPSATVEEPGLVAAAGTWSGAGAGSVLL